MPYAWAWKQNNMCCLLQIHLEELGKWRSDHTEEIIYKLYCIAWELYSINPNRELFDKYSYF
jgi:hypothetical protein